MSDRSVLKLSRSLPVLGTSLLCAFGSPATPQSCDQPPSFGTGISLGLSPVQIHIADVNADGNQDIISVENGAIKTVFGNGDGTFLFPVTTVGPATPSASVVGNWNNDGFADLAVASGGSVTSFRGDPILGFVPANGPYAVGATVGSLVNADFDGDGIADVLVAGTPSDVYLLTGNGDGTFNTPPIATLIGPADKVRVGDFDGDLVPDIAVLRRFGSTVSVFLNDGSGTFVMPAASINAFPAAAWDLAVDDFNRDGRLDLAVISQSPSKALYVRLGLGGAQFAGSIQSLLATNNPEIVLVGHFNADAFPDLTVTQQGSIDFEVLLGAGDGSFASLLSLSLGGNTATGEAVGDLDGDGLDDVVFAFAGGDRIAFNTTGEACVSFVSATSTGGSLAGTGQNVLQWLNGPLANGVRIRYNSAPTRAACTAPASATIGGGTNINPVFTAGRQTYIHSGLNPGTYYCYSVFALNGATYSSPRSVTARPFNTTTGFVKWGFTTGASALAPPGNGMGVVHVVANDAVVYAVKKGAAGGTWPDGPPEWKPRRLPEPTQGRPSTVGVAVGSATQVIFLGAQDGHVYALDAQRGDVVWRSPLLGAGVQAAPSGMFVAFGGNHDYILVGTRNTAVPNAFYALQLSDGSLAWTFDGGGFKIGEINGQAYVDYVGRRVYFTSLKYDKSATPNPDDTHTVWCVDLDTGTRLWSTAVGNVVGSAVVRQARPPETRGRVYVGSWDGATGQIHALDADNGLPVWVSPFSTGANGPVKAYVGADRLSDRLLFSTTDKLWALDDPPGSAAAPAVPVWVRDGSATSTEPPAQRITGPSAPAFLAAGPWIFVGSSNGKVYRLDYATGSTQLEIPLGDPSTPATVGGLTLDIRGGFFYAGTVGGVIYGVVLPP